MKRPDRPQPAHPAPVPTVAPRTPRRIAEPRAKPAKQAKPERSARRVERLARRDERAEVKRFTRHARRRRIGWLAVLGVLAVTAALIATAVFSPILALREIRIEGTSRLDPVAIEEAVSGQLGTPLALLDEGRIRDDLSQFTGIRSFVTELVPPGTLVIHLVERSPLGVVATPAGFDAVDAAGVVLETSPARPPGLPLLEVDGGAAGAGFEAMVEVLLALPPEVLARVDSVSARTQDDVTLLLAGSDQRVLWGGAADSDRKAAVFAHLLARFAGAGPGEYDVSAPGSAVFRRD